MLFVMVSDLVISEVHCTLNSACNSMFIDVYLCYCRTLEERAQRLFLTKGKNLEELDQSLFAKAKPGKTGKSK